MIVDGTSKYFVPDLCQIEVKTSKNKHKQIKPNKNWNFLGINELRRNMMCFWGLRKQCM